MAALGILDTRLQEPHILVASIPVYKASPKTVPLFFAPVRFVTWMDDDRAPHTVDRGGYIAGTLMQEGQPLINSMVSLYFTRTNRLIERTRTDALGGFRFDVLDQTINEYAVLASNPPYAPIAFDRITPSI